MHTENSILINRNVLEVFTITNNLENWTELFNDYESVTLLDHVTEGKKETLRFEIRAFPHDHEDGDDDDSDSHIWRSQREIDWENLVAVARRETPFPFERWKLTVKYEARPDGQTLMTWVQDFNMDPRSSHTDEEIAEWINKESKSELEQMKQRIEAWAMGPGDLVMIGSHSG